MAKDAGGGAEVVITGALDKGAYWVSVISPVMSMEYTAVPLGYNRPQCLSVPGPGFKSSLKSENTKAGIKTPGRLGVPAEEVESICRTSLLL